MAGGSTIPRGARLPDALAKAARIALRALPKRGRARIARRLNGAMLGTHAGPVMLAPMVRGHRILVDLRSQTEFLAYYFGTYDEELLDLALAVARPAAVFADVGANIGFYTVPLGSWHRDLVDG